MNQTDRRVRLIQTITTFGLTESATGEKLSDFLSEFPEIKLGLRAKFPEIQIKFYVQGKNEAHLAALLKAASDWVVEKIGRKVISVDGDPMEAVVGRLLKRKNATLALAESCTGGLISNWLTDVPGSSDYFLFSGVTYSNRAKIDVLGVSEDTLIRWGAVHEQTAKEMARGAQRISGATYGLSVSGIAGPSGGTADKPVGTVCIGLAAPGGVKGYRFGYNYGSRLRNKTIFAMRALDQLRRELL